MFCGVFGREEKVRRLREYIIINALLLLFMAVLLCLHPVDDIRKYDVVNQYDFTERAIIYGEKTVAQEFVCGADCDSIEIQAATTKVPTGKYEVVLRDEEGAVIGSWSREEIDLTGDWVSFKCPGQVMKAGNRYELEVSAPGCDVSQALVLSLGYDEFKTASMGTFRYENFSEEEQAYYSDKALSMATYKSHRNVFAYMSFIIVFIALNLCLLWKEKGIRYLAPVVLTASCLVMLLSLSPGSGLDDEYHYYSSVKLSNIMMGRENAGEVEETYRYDLKPDINANYNFLNVLENIRHRKGDNEVTTLMMDGHGDRLTWPVSHFAPAVGITMGRLLNMNFIQIYTMARITSMFMYIIMVLAAIDLTPVNKELMLMLASTPMITQQATQITYDTVINGLVFLLVGYVLYLMFAAKDVGWKEVIITIVIAGLMGPVKVIYSALVLLVLAVPKSVFSSGGNNVIKKAAVIIPVFLITLLNKYSAGKGSLTHTDKRVGRPGYTISFAIHDPVRYFKVVARSMEDDLTFYLKQAAGMQLGGRDVEIPELIIFGFVIILIVCAVSGHETFNFTGIQRLIWAGTAVIGTGALFAFFVFGATAYGSPKADGLQGRYYIPFVIPFMYALRSEKVNIKLERVNLLIPFWFMEMGCLIHIMSQINYTI